MEAIIQDTKKFKIDKNVKPTPPETTISTSDPKGNTIKNVSRIKDNIKIQNLTKDCTELVLPFILISYL